MIIRFLSFFPRTALYWAARLFFSLAPFFGTGEMRQTHDQRLAVQRGRVARRAQDLVRELNKQMRELIRLGIECDIQAGDDGHSVSLWVETD